MEAEVSRRCERNRNRTRPGGRRITCPIHGFCLKSCSRKYPIFAENLGQLREGGISKRRAQLSLTVSQTVPLQHEWLESFWCNECNDVTWYHVRKVDDRHLLQTATPEHWQRATGVAPPPGFNPSVSEFSQREAHLNVLRIR